MQWIVDRLAESVGMTLPRQPALVHFAFVKQKRFCLFAEVRLIVCRRCWLNSWLGLGFLATHEVMRNFAGKTIIETLFFAKSCNGSSLGAASSFLILRRAKASKSFPEIVLRRLEAYVTLRAAETRALTFQSVFSVSRPNPRHCGQRMLIANFSA